MSHEIFHVCPSRHKSFPFLARARISSSSTVFNSWYSIKFESWRTSTCNVWSICLCPKPVHRQFQKACEDKLFLSGRKSAIEACQMILRPFLLQQMHRSLFRFFVDKNRKTKQSKILSDPAMKVLRSHTAVRFGASVLALVAFLIQVRAETPTCRSLSKWTTPTTAEIVAFDFSSLSFLLLVQRTKYVQVQQTITHFVIRSIEWIWTKCSTMTTTTIQYLFLQLQRSTPSLMNAG